jgi:aminopeptidase YwaD
MSITIGMQFAAYLCIFTDVQKNKLSMFFRGKIFYILLIVGLPLSAQKLKKEDKLAITHLRHHIDYLSDDKLEGRRAGTMGEKLAMEYIRAEFEKNGLVPKGDHGTFFQAFDIKEGKELTKNNSLLINDEEIKGGDYFPFVNSPRAKLETFPSIALKESGVPWFEDLKEELLLNQANPHFDLQTFIIQKARLAAAKGATALFVYNTSDISDKLAFDGRATGETLPLPVVYIARGPAKKYFTDETAVLGIQLEVELKDKVRKGHNVIGFVDNGSASTVIIGAHYDHLGFGEDGNSLFRGQEKQVHNGADDNASGTAALIELSALLKKSPAKNNNYLFIAFSGEELGLYGSRYFVEHPTVLLKEINYMINMDMIGRLSDSAKTVHIGGYGSSPAWGAVFSSLGPDKNFMNKFDSSGSGPSDHTSFNMKNIPVLFFFTGIHGDYHKPSDDADKLNITGEYRILKYVYRVIEKADKMGRLAFAATRQAASGSMVKLSVTMGILPDYSFGGPGVKVDGVSSGRPAEIAGLKPGDIVIQLGEYPVSSLEGYMQVLNKFKAGDLTRVKVKRAGEILETDIKF